MTSQQRDSTQNPVADFSALAEELTTQKAKSTMIKQQISNDQSGIGLVYGRKPIDQVLQYCQSTITDKNVLGIISSYNDEIGAQYDPGWGASFMASHFHPPLNMNFLTEKFMNEIGWVTKKCGYFQHGVTVEKAYAKGSYAFIASKKPLEMPQANPVSLLNWANQVMLCAGLENTGKFVKTSNAKEELKRGLKASRGRRGNALPPRKTCKAIMKKLPQAMLKGTPFAYYGNRQRAIRCVSKLLGRLKIAYPAWLTANALPIAKSGLIHQLIEQFVNELYCSWSIFVKLAPASASLVLICISVFSERKELFNEKGQKQGGLNKHMEALLNLVLTNEVKACPIIGLILPFKNVYENIPEKYATCIYDTSMIWLKHMAKFMDEQWNKGVKKAVRRTCRMLPSGAGINTAGYNACADAWMNLRRFVNVSAQYIRIVPPLILKTMQLIADDVWKMNSGTAHVDAHIYKSITAYDETEGRVLPWDVILRPETWDVNLAMKRLLMAIEEHNGNIETWIGISQLRKVETKEVPCNMICGVKVPQMSHECAEFLKRLGIFGARPNIGT